MNTILRIQKRDHPYVQIDKRTVEDPRLSWKAKGLLAYLLSRPPQWTVVVKDLINRSSDGRESVYSALRELLEFGYAEYHQTRDKGKIVGSQWIVHEEPIIPATNGKAVYGKTESGSSVYGKPATSNKDRVSKKERSKREVVLPSASTKPFKHPEKPVLCDVWHDGAWRVMPKSEVVGARRTGESTYCFASGEPWINPDWTEVKHLHPELAAGNEDARRELNSVLASIERGAELI